MKPRRGDKVINTPEALRDLFDGTMVSTLGAVLADCVDGSRPQAHGATGTDPYQLALDAALLALKAAMLLRPDDASAEGVCGAQADVLRNDGSVKPARCVLPAGHPPPHDDGDDQGRRRRWS